MEFRVVYRGLLPAQNRGTSAIDVKHAIRKFLHPQLKELWAQNRASMGDPNDVANRFIQFGFRFAPVIPKIDCGHCALHILLLRRDAPGNLITYGGDIDNRLKVLFDGLRKPNDEQEVSGQSPGEGEDPFFCLLEEDSLVTEVHVVTDRLLRPCGPEEDKHSVELVIHVKSDHDVAHASDVQDAKLLALMNS